MSKSDLDRGIEHVDASEDAGGSYLYWEQGTSRWYRVTATQLTELGEMLAKGIGDAYSHWCAATVAEELPGDERIEALRDEAAVAGDGAQVALCEAALGGDVSARGRCAKVIADAQAAAGA